MQQIPGIQPQLVDVFLDDMDDVIALSKLSGFMRLFSIAEIEKKLKGTYHPKGKPQQVPKEFMSIYFPEQVTDSAHGVDFINR